MKRVTTLSVSAEQVFVGGGESMTDFRKWLRSRNGSPRRALRRLITSWARSPRSIPVFEGDQGSEWARAKAKICGGFSALAAVDTDHGGGIEDQLRRITLRAHARIGAAAMHLETGARVSLCGTERFHMASTVKVPLAVQLLSLIAEGVVQRDTLIELHPDHIHPGDGLMGLWLARHFQMPGVALSVHNLFDLMLVHSDNSATDVIFDLVGGPAAVTNRLRKLGITDISVDRSTIQLLTDVFGADTPSHLAITPDVWRATLAAIPPERRMAARQMFLSDLRDTATPDAMVDLLAAISRNQALSPPNSTLLLSAMKRCVNGPRRLKRLFPADTLVAHKTGSLPIGVVNDVGIATLPNGAGRIALAIFVTEAQDSVDEMEWLIARVARALFIHFWHIMSIRGDAAIRL